MRWTRANFTKLLLVIAALVLPVAACGGDDGGGGGGGGDGGALAGKTFTVGSKEFTEQLILGQITKQALEAEGAKVNDQIGLAGTVVARKALTSGEIDMYWEYTGTGWITHLGQTKPIPDPQEQYEAVAKEDEAKNNIVWLDPAPANNTYAFAVRSEDKEKLGVETLSDVAQLVKERPDDATLCIGTEFATRDDGLPGVEEAYGFDWPDDQLKKMQEGVIYQQLDKGACEFGDVFQTDGRIAALDLALVEDDKSFFPIYNPALNVRKEVLDESPELRDLFAEIAGKLETETLQKLNAQVDVEGIPEDEVAKTWLEDEGITG